MTKKAISKIQGISKLLKNSNNVLKRLETVEKYSSQLDEIGRLTLDREDAQIDIQIYVKVTLPEEEHTKGNGPADLLKNLRDAKNPNQFVDALNNIDESIHPPHSEDTAPKYWEANLDNIDNSTFLIILDKLLSHYKTQSSQLLTKLKSIL